MAAAPASGYDVVIDMHGGPRSSWLTLATGAPQRIGYDIAGPAVDVHADRRRAPRELRPRHSVLNQWDLLEGIDGWTGRGRRTRRATPSRCRSTRRRSPDRRRGCARPASRPDHELIVLHVSASNPFRRWPEPAFAEVVAGLVSRSPDRRVVLSSGPSDRLAADRIVGRRAGAAARRGAVAA